jgi:hypothetical protein
MGVPKANLLVSLIGLNLHIDSVEP